MGIFFLATAFVSVFVAWLLRALYWELPIVFALAGIAYLLKSVIVKKKKRPSIFAKRRILGT